MAPAPDATPASRTPPVPVFAAAVLAMISALVTAFFGVLVLAFSGGRFEGSAWLLVVVPVMLFVGLVAGAVLLLTGRSWLVLAVAAGVMTALVLTGYVAGGWGGGSFGVLTLVVPLLTTVLAALPRVRSWVAARRAARAGG
ncbi:hypothetical protein [Blastococcus deserti]|uniref:Tryptophan-associated transmembrane protein n=1 Tax=Blastococcus deserti TaxID=2259033 RepID=A0ABW4XCW7_9ACTN